MCLKQGHRLSNSFGRWTIWFLSVSIEIYIHKYKLETSGFETGCFFSFFSFVQALKVESGFICLMAIFLLISIIPLFTLMIWICSRDQTDELNQFQQSAGDDEIQTNPIISFDDTNIDSTVYCRRVLQFLLQFFSVFLMWVSCCYRNDLNFFISLWTILFNVLF